MEKLNWQKSSFSGEDADCIEIASGSSDIHIRESDDPATVITATKAQLAAWIEDIKADNRIH
ncbi:DUF397 domain-containing protein [Kitasatospora sp. NPDC056327]|uniref:DUF397 domain-containing protein n=1 Tax=Kitasatospora sp. NPDC056327 TaxID=3345785 RepID=UPI0035D8C614